jgi:hypothetical protein
LDDTCDSSRPKQRRLAWQHRGNDGTEELNTTMYCAHA